MNRDAESSSSAEETVEDVESPAPYEGFSPTGSKKNKRNPSFAGERRAEQSFFTRESRVLSIKTLRANSSWDINDIGSADHCFEASDPGTGELRYANSPNKIEVNVNTETGSKKTGGKLQIQQPNGSGEYTKRPSLEERVPSLKTLRSRPSWIQKITEANHCIDASEIDSGEDFGSPHHWKNDYSMTSDNCDDIDEFCNKLMRTPKQSTLRSHGEVHSSTRPQPHKDVRFDSAPDLFRDKLEVKKVLSLKKGQHKNMPTALSLDSHALEIAKRHDSKANLLDEKSQKVAF
eukprot:UN26064